MEGKTTLRVSVVLESLRQELLLDRRLTPQATAIAAPTVHSATAVFNPVRFSRGVAGEGLIRTILLYPAADGRRHAQEAQWPFSILWPCSALPAGVRLEARAGVGAAHGSLEGGMLRLLFILDLAVDVLEERDFLLVDGRLTPP
ncbi:MAG: hypothetical protein M0Z27_01180 [Thermaerobacter sp.]|nr:hypothetical protein [Thermaerobacter sp.]